MTQAERDRLVTLKKAKKKLITQCEAAEELKLSVRQVKRLLKALEQRGDEAVIHGLCGKPSKRRIAESVEREAVKILSAPVYEKFAPTLASEYLASKHGIQASKETVRQWMLRAKLWRGKKPKVKEVHLWRPRRSRVGELVQWDTSEHDWLEGRGEKLPPTQIGRGLQELGITWIAAHSPARAEDAHRPLEKSHNLAAALSHMETRQVDNDYTLRWDGKRYRIERQSVTSGLRRATVRVEKRLDGSLALRFGERYLAVEEVCPAQKRSSVSAVKPAQERRGSGRRGSDWNQDFDLKKGPKVWQAAHSSGHRPSGTD